MKKVHHHRKCSAKRHYLCLGLLEIDEPLGVYRAHRLREPGHSKPTNLGSYKGSTFSSERFVYALGNRKPGHPFSAVMQLNKQKIMRSGACPRQSDISAYEEIRRVFVHESVLVP